MALDRYTDARVDINSAMLCEHTSVSVSRNTGATDVNTVGKGWAGQSPGSKFMEIAIDSAVPAAGFEYDPGNDMEDMKGVSVTIYAAGKTLATSGLITADDFKHAVNSEAIQNLKIKCLWANWQ